MIYLFAIIILLLLYVFYLQHSFLKERKKYIEIIAAKDYSEFKAFENSEKNAAKEKKNLFTARNEREKAKSR